MAKLNDIMEKLSDHLWKPAQIDMDGKKYNFFGFDVRKSDEEVRQKLIGKTFFGDAFDFMDARYEMPPEFNIKTTVPFATLSEHLPDESLFSEGSFVPAEKADTMLLCHLEPDNIEDCTVYAVDISTNGRALGNTYRALSWSISEIPLISGSVASESGGKPWLKFAGRLCHADLGNYVYAEDPDAPTQVFVFDIKTVDEDFHEFMLDICDDGMHENPGYEPFLVGFVIEKGEGRLPLTFEEALDDDRCDQPSCYLMINPSTLKIGDHLCTNVGEVSLKDLNIRFVESAGEHSTDGEPEIFPGETISRLSQYVELTLAMQSGNTAVLADYGIDMVQFALISQQWVAKLAEDPQLTMRFGELMSN